MAASGTGGRLYRRIATEKKAFFQSNAESVFKF
jgi:hypothetical protein